MCGLIDVGQLKKDGSTGKGTIQMPYISDEQNGEDFEIRVTIENEANRDLKDEVRTAVIPVMKEKIGIMLTEFKNSNASSIIHQICDGTKFFWVRYCGKDQIRIEK